MDEKSGKSKEVTDPGMGEFRTEKLIPEWGWWRDMMNWFQRQGET